MPTDPKAQLTPKQVEQLRTAMLETFFSATAKDWLKTPEGIQAIDDQATVRYFDCLDHIVPWVARTKSLRDATVLEIGCGAGASTAAFAQQCKRIVGFDIDANGLEGARRRMEILGLHNVELRLVEPATLLTSLGEAGKASGGADVVLLYAVLEHQTTQERIDTLRLGWELLRDGGVLVVTDTPNRLTYSDYHTAFLPFYHMLPHDLAVLYASKSKRATFPESIAAFARMGQAQAEEHLVRWGRGASYHEFELAIGAIEDKVVGDGFDPEILRSKPITIEERLLYTYFRAFNVPVPPGFARQCIDVILKKGATSPAHSRAAELITELR
jgi:S-adenosylmethionine-dependent methyltransferase